MRKWLVIAVGCCLFVFAVAVMRPVGERPQAPGAAPDVARVLPDFEAVEVSSGTGEGLALSGRVLDPGGQPVAAIPPARL